MIRVNLLKAEAKTVEKKGAAAEAAEPKAEAAKKSSNIGNLILFGVIVIVGSLAFLQKRALDNEHALLAEAQEQQRVLTPVLQKLDMVEQQKIFLEKKIGLIEDLRGRQAVPLQILDTLTRGLPDWVWLVDATLQLRNLDVKGRAISNIQISDYAKALQKSGLFSTVTVVSTQQRSVGTNVFVEFVINAVILESSPKPAGAPAKPEAK